MSGSETDVLERIDVKEPGLWNVVLLNDDSTPMQFVVQILIEIFQKNSSEAYHIMMDIHEKESGIAGTYYKEIALQKQIDTVRVSQEYGYELKVKKWKS